MDAWNGYLHGYGSIKGWLLEYQMNRMDGMGWDGIHRTLIEPIFFFVFVFSDMLGWGRETYVLWYHHELFLKISYFDHVICDSWCDCDCESVLVGDEKSGRNCQWVFKKYVLFWWCARCSISTAPFFPEAGVVFMAWGWITCGDLSLWTFEARNWKWK